ncbi:hypothetical protein BCVP_CDS0013 [Bacillus phage BC-VP]|nr:hypothetical protein BCVP_CDS0013 [Bacillus phage BC-VP]
MVRWSQDKNKPIQMRTSIKNKYEGVESNDGYYNK